MFKKATNPENIFKKSMGHKNMLKKHADPKHAVHVMDASKPKEEHNGLEKRC